MRSIFRFIFFNFLVRPVVHLWLGVRGKHLERLPENGPAIVCANHNSHLDAMVLLTLFPRRLSRKVKAVAAADYFLRGRLMSWFSMNVLGIVPLKRKVQAGEDPLAPIVRELEQDHILILFPEGSRGEPEKLNKFKNGIARLAERYPDVPVYPVFMHGLGKSLPRGQFILVPFFCDVVAGAPLYFNPAGAGPIDAGNNVQEQSVGVEPVSQSPADSMNESNQPAARRNFMIRFQNHMQNLASEVHIPEWE